MFDKDRQSFRELRLAENAEENPADSLVLFRPECGDQLGGVCPGIFEKVVADVLDLAAFHIPPTQQIDVGGHARETRVISVPPDVLGIGHATTLGSF
jgi:hypothetical protein